MAELLARILFEGVDKASPEIRKVQKALRAATKDIQERNKAVSKSFKGVAGTIKTVALAFSGLGAGLVGIVKSTANAGDEFLKTSQKVGVSIEALQRLAFAADLAGVNQEGLAVSLKFLNKNLVEARSGSKELGKAFKLLKLDPKKLGDTEEAFIKIGGAIGALRDEQLKTAISTEIFGRSGNELIPLFNQGADAIRAAGKELEDMGGIIGIDLAKRSEEFNDNISRTLRWIGALKTVLGAELLPVFEEVIQNTLKWFSVNKDLIRLKIKDFAKNLLEFFDFLKKEGPGILSKIKGIVDALGGVVSILKVIGVVWALAFGVKVVKLLVSISSLIGAMTKGLIAFSGVAKLAAGSLSLLGLSLAAIAGSIFLVVKRKEATAWLKEQGLGFLVDGSIIKLLEPIGQHFARVWQGAGQDITALKNVAVEVFDVIGGHLRTVFVEPLQTVKALFVSAFQEIQDTISGVFQGLAGRLQAMDPGRFLLSKFGINLPPVGGVQPQSSGAVAGASAQGGRDLYSRLSNLTQAISGQQDTLKKPQQLEVRVKVDSPVPAQVTTVKSSPGLTVKANTGQMMP